MPSTDPKIIDRLQTGDRSALERIEQEMGAELLAFVINRCPAGASPDDVVQDVWLRVWRSRDQYQRGSFRGWVYQIAKNRILDIHRKKRPDLMADQFDPPAPEFDPPDPQLELLNECLELGGQFVEAIRLQLKGLSTEEIADHMQINHGTVGSRISRGKKQLRECIERKML